MFLIVPKRTKTTAASLETNADAASGSEGSRMPRAATACDSCRIKKTKVAASWTSEYTADVLLLRRITKQCNGQQPCALCQRRRFICVYSRPTSRDVPVSPAQVSLLEHQQRRLFAAVQQMASIIAKYEGGSDQAPSSFDVLEQLEKYAPQHLLDEQPLPEGSNQAASRRSKRRRGDESAAYIPPLLEDGVNNSPAWSHSEIPCGNQMGTHFSPNSISDNASACVAPSVPPVAFMNLVDWDTSLQNLQNANNYFFSDEEYSPETSQNNGFNTDMIDDLTSFNQNT
ncbi:hypothetical protein M433DRAFT_464175 [Acidomyces richmondensis BFW]|nr:hypothetical protein M433DRAFT_464175 [Acidomyces richmondensis BFW]